VRNMTASIKGSNVPVSFTVREPAATAAAIRRHFRKEDKDGRCRIRGTLVLVLKLGSQQKDAILTGSKVHEEHVIASAIMSMNGTDFNPASLKSIEVGDIGEMRA
jgi:hypothetical protein